MEKYGEDCETSSLGLGFPNWNRYLVGDSEPKKMTVLSALKPRPTGSRVMEVAEMHILNKVQWQLFASM